MNLYKIKTIAQLSGYPPELLRAWERRHGLLEPLRTESGHRLYTPDDLQVLTEIRRRLEAGAKIGEIAAAGRQELLRESGRSSPPTGPMAWVQRALRCAMELDTHGLERVLDEAFAQLGADAVVEQILIPASHEIGRLWERGEATVTAEHLQSTVYARRLERLIEAGLPYAQPEPLYLVTCLEGEQHDLGARLVNWYLVRAGVAPLYAAPGLPLSEVEQLCTVRRPVAVLLSVAREGVLLNHLDELGSLAARIPTQFWVGGGGIGPHRARLEQAGLICWPGDRPLRELPSALANAIRSRPG